jgi:hypothetical protein
VIELMPGSDGRIFGTDGTLGRIPPVAPFRRFVTSPTLGRLGTPVSDGRLGTATGRSPGLGRLPTAGMLGIAGTPIFGSDGICGRPGTTLGVFGTETPGTEGSVGAEIEPGSDAESKLALALKPPPPPDAVIAPFAGAAGTPTPCDRGDAEVALTLAVAIAAATRIE